MNKVKISIAVLIITAASGLYAPVIAQNDEPAGRELREGNDGEDHQCWGLAGLLGLIGLAGLRKKDDHRNVTHTTTHPRS